jgi:hydrogenase/urease accessory protein HupE
MNTEALTIGLACIAAGIVGGGLQASGVQFPVLASRKRQAALIIFGLLVLFFARLATMPDLFNGN